MDLALNSRRNLVRRPVTEHLAGLGLVPVTQFAAQQQWLVQRRAGQIVVQGGELSAVFGRWWPYLGNRFQAAWHQRFRQKFGDRCELFYHTALSSPRFLTLSYLHSTVKTSVTSIRAATLVLDEIARLKGSVAIVCNVSNERLTDRILERWGWKSHCPAWRGRHYIKRFYGTYPSISASWRDRLQL